MLQETTYTKCLVKMRKVFWENPYQHTLKTTVAAVEGNEVLFNETIAYAFNGGQEDDKVTINGMQVLKIRKDDDNYTIHYTLDSNHGLKVGDEVVMKIDWQRRYRLMRLHFAAELVLEIVNKILNQEEQEKNPEHRFTDKKTGAHISEHKARIDFIYAVNISKHFEKTLQEYNQIISANKPIIKDYDDEATQRRFWQIEGFAKVPCGGTHVETTGEVGFVQLKREKVGTSAKPCERIHITLMNDGAEEYKKQIAEDMYNQSHVARGFKTI